MAIAFVAGSSAGNASGTSLTINPPTGLAAGHVQVLTVYLEHGQTSSPAVSVSGGATWTQVHETLQNGASQQARWFSQWTFIQVAGSSEPASYSVTWVGSASIWRAGAILAFSGVDNTSPQDATATEQKSATSSTSAVAPGLTTVTAAAWVVYAEADFAGTTVTAPTGFTEPATHGDFANTHVSYKEFAAAGATGDQTGTLASTSFNTAQLVALRPAGGGGGAGPTLFARSLLGVGL